MDRRHLVPGWSDLKNWEFIYIENQPGDSFEIIITDLFESCPEIKLSDDVAVFEDRTTAILPDGRVLKAFSYDRKWPELRAKFACFCAATNREYGFAENGILVLAGGVQYSLDDCKITIEDVVGDDGELTNWSNK